MSNFFKTYTISIVKNKKGDHLNVFAPQKILIFNNMHTMVWLKKTLTNFFHNLINSQLHLFLPTRSPFFRENLRKKRKSAGAKSKIHPTLRSIFLAPSLLLFPFPFAPFSFAFFIFYLLFSLSATEPPHHTEIFFMLFLFFNLHILSL